MAKIKLELTPRIINNIKTGVLKIVVTDREFPLLDQPSKVVELRSAINNRIKYYTDEKAINDIIKE